MNKILSVLFLSLYFLNLYAEGLTAEQLQLKSDIFTFLKEEKMNPVDQESGVISFAKDGTTYVVTISETDIAPMYVTLSVSYSYAQSDYEYFGVMLTANHMNWYKGVKFFCNEESIMFQAEMYLHESEPFRYAFFRLLELMEAMHSGFPNAYKETMEAFESDSNNEKNVDSNKSSTGTNPKVVSFPSVESKSDNKLYLTKITIDDNYTILDLTSYNNKGTVTYEWCTIGRNASIIANGQKLRMIKAEGIAIDPEHTYYPNENSSVSFRLYFPSISRNQRTIDFVESNDGWWIKGINLGSANSPKAHTSKKSKLSVNSIKIDTQFHSWTVVSVELLSDCTVVHKRVTPKTTDTKVWSETSEYIEDSNTGKKYYIKSSSIGIGSNATTLYGKDPVDFTETYPALPENVKTINISSGSQYYVRNFKCR